MAATDLVYLDGNSLGRLPRRSIERLRTVVEREWGSRLVRSWNERWMDLPLRAGDSIGEHLVGAAPGQVAVSDSTSVNLYKLAVAALDDMAAINAVAHRAGALTLWDLCHSVGAVPVELDASGADLAVGCTYKYLNAGPGAPAFLYVRREHQARLVQPIWGWFGQRDQFAMAQGYDPAPDLSRFLVGTPFVPGIALVEEGVALLAEAGIQRLRAKGIALTELVIELHDAWLAPLGFTLASPRDATVRGAHVSLAHPEGYRICRALVERAGVVPDFRPPDRIRLGPAPVATRFVDAWDAMDRLRRVVADGLHHRVDPTRARVT